MLKVYRQLLRLYPAAYRQQFGEEMLSVLLDVRADHAKKNLFDRATFSMREIFGLIAGALGERFSAALGLESELSLSTRSFTMHDGFRFPKSTAVLMTVILAGVVVAIKRGEE